MVKTLKNLLNEKGLLNGYLLGKDGAYGTPLEHEHKLGQYHIGHENRPRLVKELRTQYILAGARIIGTHTFPASFEKLMMQKLADRIEEINQSEIDGLGESIAAARNVERGKDRLGNDLPEEFLTYASIGPYGNCYRGESLNLQPGQYKNMHTPQLKALYNEERGFGVDMILSETNAELTEVLGIVNAIRAIDNDITIVISFYLGEYNDKPGHAIVSKYSINDSIKFVLEEIGYNADPRKHVDFAINCCDIETIIDGISADVDKGTTQYHDRIVGIYTNPLGETSSLKENTHDHITYDHDQIIELNKHIHTIKEDHFTNLLFAGICCGAKVEDVEQLNGLFQSWTPEKD